MNTTQGILVGALAFTLVLGFIIFLTNRKRSSNQQFLVLSLMVGSWLFSVLVVFRSHDEGAAAFWIRTASAAGAFIPLAFMLLRLSIQYPERRFWGLMALSSGWLLTYAGIVIYCFTPLYLERAEIPPSGVPNAFYGRWAVAFPVYFFGALLLVIWDFTKSLRQTQGVRRQELLFVLMGLFTFLGVGLFAAVLPLVTSNSQSVTFAPLCVILMDSIIAYGIATQRIMDVGIVVRRGISYALLLIYLGALYLATGWGSHFFLKLFHIDSDVVPPLLGTIVVAFTISGGRVHNLLQVFINRLFINLHEVRLSDLLKTADSVLAVITTTNDLLNRFTQMLIKEIGTDFAAICLFEHKDGKQLGSVLPSSREIQFKREDPLSCFLQETRKPLLGSIAHRMRPSSGLEKAVRQLKEMGSALAIGIHANDSLVGIVLLGERLSGRVYNQSEQDALQILVNHLAKALENAKLYTRVQNAKMYNDVLVDSLVSGVIAVDDQAQITVVNREASRILRCNGEQFIGKPVEVLPEPIYDLFQSVLRKREVIQDEEAELKFPDGSACTVRLGSSVFRNPDKESIGALVVMHDISIMKELEMQVHRSDRLATIGKLSASMAHEIKNPLVAIKTFAQLLTERSQDKQFVAKFSQILSHEVERISRTIAELLGYSRLGSNHFQPLHVHAAIQKATGLLKPQLQKKRIQLVTHFAAEKDLIQADSDRFQQILVNLLLNASEAIEESGTITVRTQVVNGKNGSDYHKNGSGNGTHEEWLGILIQDNGKGISPQDLKRIFDPFFTTKRTGTGLGLSLTSSLVTAHKGIMDADSQLGQGTTFRLQFPLTGN